ncbi:MAG: tRNA 2-thiocytidine(32) synthetase TtcA [Deltaproteobacteria bacterium]|nr:tRNA 2-thiocytidine(32) synthetase TtcA [Deltaproteobacteria bacterium]
MTGSHNNKPVYHAVGKAIRRYSMISDGDRIAVGLSGGKDSLTLLTVLEERRRWVPIDYTLVAFYIDLGFPGKNSDIISAYCREKGYDFHVVHTDYGLRGHSQENRENPCFLCAHLRRKRLFELAHEWKCNKLALGHNKDDIIETLFLNMCYSGEISTMVPSQIFFKGALTVIRPLAFMDKKLIARFAQEKNFPDLANPCPSAQNSKRTEIRDMLDRLYRSNNKIKGNIFRAMQRVKTEYLL